MDTGIARKRGRLESGLNANNGFKKSKQEMEFNSTGIGSKSKPCTKFFSTAGCPFGEGCHFLHYVPGGFKAVAQFSNLGGNHMAHQPSPRNQSQQFFNDNPSPQSGKTRLCNKYNTAEGCRFGDKCHFAHGEWELGKPVPFHDDHRVSGPGRFGGHPEPSPHGAAAASSFGSSATAKISVDASLAGAIIGKGGVNSKQICRVTGVKLAIREHDSDPNSRNIELEGTFDQIKEASVMVRELIVNISSGIVPTPRNHHHPNMNLPGLGGSGGAGNNFKTKLCDNFTKGSCTFGERCHFAHGADEMRKSVI